jgi:hypothetical protein
MPSVGILPLSQVTAHAVSGTQKALIARLSVAQGAVGAAVWVECAVKP